MSPRGAARSGRASRRRSRARSSVERSSGRSANAASRKPTSPRKASSLPECGVAVTRIRLPALVGGELGDELVALMATAAPGARDRRKVCASSTITSFGQARTKSSRRRSDLM